MTRHYPDLASSSDWLNQISHAARPIRSTTQIWVVARHQYGIFALVSQTSFGRETSGSVSKCRLFSQAKKYSDVTSLVLTILQVFYLITYSIKCIFLNFSPFIVSIHKELGAKILPRGMIWLFPIVCHPLNNMERHARLTVPLVITLAALHLLAARWAEYGVTTFKQSDATVCILCLYPSCSLFCFNTRTIHCSLRLLRIIRYCYVGCTDAWMN